VSRGRRGLERIDGDLDVSRCPGLDEEDVDAFIAGLDITGEVSME